MIIPIRRALATVSLIVLAFGAAGCGGEDTATSCSINSCTVTFNRGADAASASILGTETELVGVKEDKVTLKVAGQTWTVPVNGQQEADGFTIAVQSVTDDKVVVKISQGGG
jgi:hypothetical protein